LITIICLAAVGGGADAAVLLTNDPARRPATTTNVVPRAILIMRLMSTPVAVLTVTEVPRWKQRALVLTDTKGRASDESAVAFLRLGAA
jgi:hypothetical protein